MRKEPDFEVVGTMSIDAVVHRVPRNARCAGFGSHAHYDRGVKRGDESDYVTIALNNTWGALADDGGNVTSYEKIGYHTGSIDFIVGVIASGCSVYVVVSEEHGYSWYRVVLG